jgi:hypothetical protein
VLMRFKLDPSLYATISPRAFAVTHLPANEPVPLLGMCDHELDVVVAHVIPGEWASTLRVPFRRPYWHPP